MDCAGIHIVLVRIVHGAGGDSQALVDSGQLNLEISDAGLHIPTSSQSRFMMPLCGLEGTLCGHKGNLSMLHLLASGRNSLSHGWAGRCGLCGL